MAKSDDAKDNVNTRPLPSTRADKPQLSAYGDIATIKVGNKEKKQTFYIHQGLFSFYSGYFRAALNGSWTESSSGVIRLETEDPLFFERFVLWLYTTKITDIALVSSPNVMIDLWLFGDRRDIPLLMNEMIDALHVDIADRWLVPSDCLQQHLRQYPRRFGSAPHVDVVNVPSYRCEYLQEPRREVASRRVGGRVELGSD